MSKVLQFVFTLFNLQGTDAFVSFIFMSAANFYILAHLVESVKNFFQVFSNSFVLFATLQRLSLHRVTYLDYHIQLTLSRTIFLFSGFSVLFFAVLLTACIYQHARLTLSSTFLQIITFFFGVFNRETLFIFCRTSPLNPPH